MRAGICILIVGAILMVGNMDYADEVAADDYYCDMVKAGSWPAYKKEVNCE